MSWLLVGVSVLSGLVLLFLFLGWLFYLHLLHKFLGVLLRVFQEKPLFIVPAGAPVDDAQNVRFRNEDGLTLQGCYLPTRSRCRHGVILFGLEFGSSRWGCFPYCDFLLANGFDVFSFEPRGQGDSDPQPGYQPMQWVTEYEVRDTEAAIAYLKGRPDADPRGIGFFGFSKGACAGLLAASRSDYVRCFATDGVFATLTTMVPYMQKWIAIFSHRKWIQRHLPWIYYWLLAGAALRALQRRHGWKFPHLEPVLPRLAPRALFMIQGGADNYIKPEMARELFERARPPKELWTVDGAKHNQSINIAGDEYRQRVLDFFHEHLARDRSREGVVRRDHGESNTVSVGARSSREVIIPRR